ncbi:hypothetical protein [Thalassoroseus pseudoceratinae]|uniref:hypothetical protein n=1 Tax=Thalassoroseus pseudoceratinae TaxID=2713176 RepID=UPI001F0F1732|nr:hypothetical protein [Thalassoroseus pseudoceratinae]
MQRSHLTRRDWLKTTTALTIATAGSKLRPSSAAAGDTKEQDVTDIDTRRELFVDDVLIERLTGQANRRLHQPRPCDIALKHDEPWEGSGSGYHSVFQDDDVYRMYYKAWHLEAIQGRLNSSHHPLFCCYAESKDGIEWQKPNLGLVEFEGSKQNNIVLASGILNGANIDAGHPAVFKDQNPDTPADSRYKAIVRSRKPRGLHVLGSPDGLHWTPLSKEPVITEGAFDSQNLAFWDPTIGKYRAYWRIFSNNIRAIRTATSDDFVHWGLHTELQYKDSPAEHLYTNQVKPYHRAPHILIGFPTRYVDRGWSDSTKALPELEHRELRGSSTERYGTAVTEGLLMASRDGVRFNRWNEAFLRPGIQRPGTWNYGHQYIAWHVVETKSHLPGAPPELSLYATESYWTGSGSALRRYTLRLDGFVSVNAPMSGGELFTKPVTFAGTELRLNFATSAAGGIRVEIQDTDGSALPGYGLDDCQVIFGDELDRTVSWKSGGDLSNLNGRPVRLRFQLKDADLYAYRFQGQT